MGTSRPRLFEPIALRRLELPNRLWVAPMCQYSSVDGMPTDWHMVHLGSFAIGRAGLVMTEATAVSPEGRITAVDAGIWNAEQAEAWARVVDFVHSQGVAIGVQLAHAGRKASTVPPGRGYVDPADGGWVTVGPSPVPYGKLPAPQELSSDGIRQVISDFAAAAERAVAAGFDLIEIHAAHGYLLNQFLSPLSNVRDDEYGGSEEGRRRLLIEVVDAVRAVIPEDMPVVVRLSATEWVDGGVTVHATAEIVAALSARGVDLVSISSGGNDDRQEIPVGPGYQVPLARHVRGGAPVPIGVAGLITSSHQAESVLVDGGADAVYFARQFLREPTFPLRAAMELGGELEWPSQYRMAKFPGSIP
ncbi:NADH:flavin oxidoreductase/NADH oxidase [Microbacterium sp. RD1]|uniref:NADH:flavin oxidoreductase/NADH oxidase n=1 Tax=Microbacterium sp. RD1 TaxID=3457313 RepID=UPI003FA60EF7